MSDAVVYDPATGLEIDTTNGNHTIGHTGELGKPLDESKVTGRVVDPATGDVVTERSNGDTGETKTESGAPEQK